MFTFNFGDSKRAVVTNSRDLKLTLVSDIYQTSVKFVSAIPSSLIYALSTLYFYSLYTSFRCVCRSETRILGPQVQGCVS